MSSTNNKKFRIQNGAAITGEVTVNGQIVITEEGKVTVPAITEAVASIVASDIATLQSQVDAILGTSPESLNTLQEIVSLFQSEDGDIQTLITNNSTAITAMQATLTSGVATTSQGAKAETAVQKSDFGTGIVSTEDSLVQDDMSSNAPAFTSQTSLTAPDPQPSSRLFQQYGVQHGSRHDTFQKVGDWTIVGVLNGDYGQLDVYYQNQTTPTYSYDSASAIFGAVVGTSRELQGPASVLTETHVYACTWENGYGNIIHKINLSTGSVDKSFTLGDSGHQSQGRPHIIGDIYYGAFYNALIKYDMSTDTQVIMTNTSLSVGDLTAYSGISISGNIAVMAGGSNATKEIVVGINLDSGTKAFGFGSPAYYGTPGTPGLPLGTPSVPEPIIIGDKVYAIANNYLSTASQYPYVRMSYDISTDTVSYHDLPAGAVGSGSVNAYARQVSIGDYLALHISDKSGVSKVYFYHKDDLDTLVHTHSFGLNEHTPFNAGGLYVTDALTAHYVRMIGTDKMTLEITKVALSGTAVSGSILVDQSVIASKVYVDAETAARTAAIAAIPATDLTPYSTTTEMNSSIATAKSEAQTYADQVVAATVDAAPAALDTLNELAAALGDDANFASTVTSSIATKADDVATTAALATKADDAATTAALATKADASSVSSIEDFLNGNAGDVTPTAPTVESTIMSPVSSDKWGQKVIVHDDVVLVRDNTYMRIYSPNDLVNHLELVGASDSEAFAYDPVTKILMAGNGKSGTNQNGSINFFHLSELIAGTGPKRQSYVHTLDSAATADPQFGRSVAFADGKFYAAKYSNDYSATPMVHVWNASDIAAQMPTDGSELLSITPITITAPPAADNRGYWGYDMAAAGNYFYVFDMFYSQVSNVAGAIFVYNTSDNQLVATLECSEDVKYFVAATENYYAVHWHGINPTKTRVYQAGTNTLVAELRGVDCRSDRMYEFGNNLSFGFSDSVSGDKGVAIYDTSDFSKEPIEITTGSEHHTVSSAQKLYAHTKPNVQVYDVSSLGGFSLQDDLEALITANTSAITAETAARTAAIAAIPATDLSGYSTTVQTTSAIATAKSEAQSYADQVVASTIDAAPASLDTLNELAAALGDDANFASTITASIATKATAADLTALEAQITGGVATLAQGALADTALQPADLVANTTAIATNASNLTALETSHSADLVNLTAKTYGVTYDPNAANVEVDSTLDMQTNAIINVAAPSAADDAATKAYVDAGQVAAISASAAALSGGLCITYDPATGTISIDETETAAALHVASSGDANALGSQSPSHYRIDVYDVNGTIVN